MSLALAVQKNASAVVAAQSSYQQNVVTVNTLMTTVLSSSLPTLNTYPPDWAEFTAAYEQATAVALQWVNTVMARLLEVPADVQNYNPIISQLLQDASNQAATLVQQPNNQIALASLNQDLTGLTTQLNLVTTFIMGAITSIQSFQQNLPALATNLQAIATKSAADAQADQAQIDQLNKDIQQLQNDISSLTAAIVALGIADAAAITLGTVATIAAWPVGALTWLVMGPVVAVATTFIALDAIQIKDDKAKIQSDQDQITGLTADVATLNLLAQNYANMATQAQAIETNLQAILAEWQTLESDVNAAITDIRTATSDAQAANFTAVQNDVNGAITEWNAAYAQAGSLQLNLQVNTAQLQVGMTDAQVQSAMAGGQTMGIIQYYNMAGTGALAA